VSPGSTASVTTGVAPAASSLAAAGVGHAPPATPSEKQVPRPPGGARSRGRKGNYSILRIEHDMEAVFALADRITVLVYGKVMFTGTPAEIREHPEVRAVYLGEGDDE